MQPSLQQAVITCHGRPLETPPRCPGVYRFFNEEAVLLYVGKSIDMATRLNSHFADARQPGRQQRMMSAVRRIDCQPTAGEVGALLMENAAIKAENPLYNRRQRRSRKLWTLRLSEDPQGFFAVVPSDFCPSGERIDSVFGLYRSRQHIDEMLRELAREHGLCLRVLGAERGSGPCFQHQIGRCRGACHGRENPAAHNERLLKALARQQIAAWPFAGPVLLGEKREGSTATSRKPQEARFRQPGREFHLLRHWSYLGSFQRRDSARRAAGQATELIFDRDSYRITIRALRRNSCALLDAVTGELLSNPFTADPLP